MKLIPLAGRGNEYLFTPEGSAVIWLSRYKKGFGRKQVSLRTEVPSEAREARDRIFASWLGERPAVSKKIKQLNSDLWPVWAMTKARKRQATIDSIKYSGQHLLPMIGDLYPEQVTEAWWENAYIPTKRTERPERKFFNEWKWLTTYLAFCHREGLIERLPRLTCPDGERAAGICLSASETDALLSHAGPDLRLQIELGLHHFMRRSEVLLLPFSEIDFEEGVIRLPASRTKTKKAREVPLNSSALDALKARHEVAKSPFVFPNRDDLSRSTGRTGNDKAWKSAIARANRTSICVNPEATFHDLRHTGLTRAFMATNRYAEICVVAGLSLDEAQRTYLHLKPEQTRFVTELNAPKGGAL